MTDKQIVHADDSQEVKHSKRMANTIRTLEKVQGMVKNGDIWEGQYYNARITDRLTIERVPQGYIIKYLAR